jgi:hypothetical protein
LGLNNGAGLKIRPKSRGIQIPLQNPKATNPLPKLKFQTPALKATMRVFEIYNAHSIDPPCQGKTIKNDQARRILTPTPSSTRTR